MSKDSLGFCELSLLAILVLTLYIVLEYPLPLLGHHGTGS